MGMSTGRVSTWQPLHLVTTSCVSWIKLFICPLLFVFIFSFVSIVTDCVCTKSNKPLSVLLVITYVVARIKNLADFTADLVTLSLQ